MIKNILVTTLAIAGLLTTIGLQAGINGHYRWVDKNGTVQYADRPPEGIDAVFIKFSTGKSSKAPEKAGASAAENQSASLPEKMEVMQKKDPVLCSQAQKNLKALDGARIRITELDGSQRFLTEEEKEGQRDNARKFIDINC